MNRDDIKIEKIEIDRDKCGDCGACVVICPTHALYMDNKTLQVNHDLCNECKQCIWLCPTNALSLKEKK